MTDPTKLRRLERLKNRPTLYEAEIVRADGERRLFCYSRKSGPALRSAMDGVRGIGVANFLGIPTSQLFVSFTRGDLRMNFCTRAGTRTGHFVHFTGRTQRDVIMDERPLPYVAEGLS